MSLFINTIKNEKNDKLIHLLKQDHEKVISILKDVLEKGKEINELRTALNILEKDSKKDCMATLKEQEFEPVVEKIPNMLKIWSGSLLSFKCCSFLDSESICSFLRICKTVNKSICQCGILEQHPHQERRALTKLKDSMFSHQYGTEIHTRLKAWEAIERNLLYFKANAIVGPCKQATVKPLLKPWLENAQCALGFKSYPWDRQSKIALSELVCDIEVVGSWFHYSTDPDGYPFGAFGLAQNVFRIGKQFFCVKLALRMDHFRNQIRLGNTWIESYGQVIEETVLLECNPESFDDPSVSNCVRRLTVIKEQVCPAVNLTHFLHLVIALGMPSEFQMPFTSRAPAEMIQTLWQGIEEIVWNPILLNMRFVSL